MTIAPHFRHEPDSGSTDLYTLFREIANGFEDAALLLKDGMICDCSDSAPAALSGARDDLIGCPIESFVLDTSTDDADGSRIGSLYVTALAGTPERIECTVRRVDGTMFDAALTVTPLRSGCTTLLLITLRDLTEPRRREAAALRRERILSAVNFAADQFLEPGDWRTRIPGILRRLGVAVNVSHLYLAEVERDEENCVRFALRFCWRAKDLVVPEGESANGPFASLNGGAFSRWINVLSEGDLICEYVRDLPAGERAALEATGARTVAMLPIFAGADWWGNIALAEVREERELTVSEVDALRTAADLIGSAIVRAQVEMELRKTNRALRTIGACNEILVRAQEEQVLLHRVCHALVEIGGYRLAWVGSVPDGDFSRITPAAHYGLDSDEDERHLLIASILESDRTASIIDKLRQGEVYVAQDTGGDLVDLTLRFGVDDRHCPSFIILPLKTSGTPLGTLALYSSKPTAFDDLEVYLLQELADDLAYGILALRTLREREEAQSALHHSEERFRQLFECAGDAIFLVGESGQIIAVNRSACEALGYSHTELTSMTVSHVAVPATPDQPRRIGEQLASIGYVFVEGDMQRQDGTSFPAEARLSLVDWDGQHAVLGIVRDVTERARAQEEKQSLQRQVFEAQKLESIGTLAGGIAHDFNNILAIILGYVSMLQTSGGLPANVQKGLTAMEAAADRGAGLVRQILTFARKSDIVYGPLDLNVMLKELRRMLQETFPRTIEVRFLPGQSLPLIMADAAQVHQALLNVCVNARDAMPDGGVMTIQTSVVDGTTVRRSFADASAASYVLIDITDTGTGMDAVTRQRIFEPFFTTKEKGKGTGLGMAVSYGAVRNHKGFIGVESDLGKGSTFHLYIPVPPNVTASPAKPRQTEVLTQGQGTILIIEDEASLAELLVTSLTAAGYKTLVARDGVSAVVLFEQHMLEVDLVLSDLGLPHLAGTDAIRWMMQHRPELKVIATTGYLEPELRLELEAIGVKDIIQKPAGTREYLLRIAAALRG
ncbi:MAG TPA: PAS domain S-box protein [bacterium]|jgi:PAS domain S-box-containing protein